MILSLQFSGRKEGSVAKTPENTALSGARPRGKACATPNIGYCHRLYTGQSIGSGMVEGAAKNLVGRRLKQTGARWRVENVNEMAELCCLTYSDHWDRYWASSN